MTGCGAATGRWGTLLSSTLLRSWDQARRMEDGLAGRGLRGGLRTLARPPKRHSARFVAGVGRVAGGPGGAGGAAVAVTMEVRGIDAAYLDHPVLAQVSLCLTGRTVLLGANGSGKTTLLRVLSGAHRPLAGEVLVGGTRLKHTRDGLRAHRRQVQLVLQDPDDQLFSADVAADVSFGPLNLGLPEAEVHDRVAEALALLQITHLAERPTHQLSYGGERKRAAIAGGRWRCGRRCCCWTSRPPGSIRRGGCGNYWRRWPGSKRTGRCW